MPSKFMTGAIASLALGTLAVGSAFAQDTVKIGLVVSMTGQQASTGKQIKAAVELYMKEHGDTVAGKKIQVILRDSGSVPDNTKRLAQELIVNDKVNVIAGFEITPAALVVAPLATEAKVVELVMAAGTSIITERSPYIVRTSFTVPHTQLARFATAYRAVTAHGRVGEPAGRCPTRFQLFDAWLPPRGPDR